MLKMIEGFCADMDKNMSVCDVGCGSGKFSKFMYDQGFRNIYGLDPSPEIDFKYRDIINFSNDSLSAFQHNTGMLFDIVMCLDVIEHIEDDRTFFDELVSILKPGGWLILQTPANPSLYSYRDKLYGHYRRYSRSMLSVLFNDRFSRVECNSLGWRVFLLAAILLGKKQSSDIVTDDNLQKNTDNSFVFQPPAIYWKLLGLMKAGYPLFYFADRMLRKTDYGAEFLVFAQKA